MTADDKSRSYYLDFEHDRMLHEDYMRGVFSPRKRVKLKRTNIVILKLNPPCPWGNWSDP